MFPIGDDNNDIEIVPFVTYGLIAINVFVFLYEMVLMFSPQGQHQLDLFFNSFAVIPREISTGRDYPPYISPWPVYITLFTSMFMHGGILHIAGNMLYLWIFGDNVEDAMGSLRFLAFYLLCGLLASAAHVAVEPAARV